jgi:hypothetical protein
LLLYVRILLIMVSISLEDCIFVDYNGLNDQITSSSQTNDCYNFKENVIQQDGPACIITQEPAAYCDATHLIPKCKGNEVMPIIVSLVYNSLIMSFFSTS